MPKRKSSSAFNKFTWLLFSIVLVFSMSSVHAAVDIDRTRIVISAHDLESDFTLANSGEDNVLLFNYGRTKVTSRFLHRMRRHHYSLSLLFLKWRGEKCDQYVCY